MLDPGLCRGITCMVHKLLRLSRLTPFGDPIDAAIGAIRETVVGLEQRILRQVGLSKWMRSAFTQRVP